MRPHLKMPGCIMKCTTVLHSCTPFVQITGSLLLASHQKYEINPPVIPSKMQEFDTASSIGCKPEEYKQKVGNAVKSN